MIPRRSGRQISNRLFVISTIIVLNSLSCFSKPVIREIKKDDCIVRLDMTSQVLYLEVQDDKSYSGSGGKYKNREAELYPDLKSIPKWKRNFVSSALVAQKMKNFDDGLLAAIEYLCQQGTEKIVGKQDLLLHALEILKRVRPKRDAELSALTRCRALLYAALVLGGGQAQVSNSVAKVAANLIAAFEKNEVRSKPIGFYTWTDKLRKVFQQDRFLQKPVTKRLEKIMLKKALFTDKSVAAGYTSILSLTEQLNNPFSPGFCDFRDEITNKEIKCTCSVIPPSAAHESELIKRLYGNRPIPQGFSLIDALINKIVSGEISLTPKKNSGWYDYKTFALEPFLLPEKMVEREKLIFGEKYKKTLVELFKGILALNRETHIKSLEIPLAGAAMPEPAVDIYPDLPCEPQATYYLRLGESYTFVRCVLQNNFSDKTLAKARRLLPNQLSAKPLLEELKEMESLMYGLFYLTAQSIGLAVKKGMIGRSPDQITQDKQRAGIWIQSYNSDIDLAGDNRMMVPVFYDIQRQKTKVWVVLGYAVKPITISYQNEPSCFVTNIKGKKIRRKVTFHKQEKSIIYPISAEVYTSKILNRNEFQALCDKYKSQSAILGAIRDLSPE